ncbi:metalloregulator ArsR/SmtB family transcription factor [Alkalihalobacillus sp. LMS39]|uniref:ArsR/SmtB family transcription factor n=1 Tax=Alkalihalobacillus sp. LMS39 TaxID=2924032 RepID=UPI002436C031|nr:metalloregulator ArsR/SmtB family transcription factor [Alkalihalobacillus sp. LMS39]
MLKSIPLIDLSKEQQDFSFYEKKFKALADTRRLQIMNVLSLQGQVCVCDLSEMFDMPQSKISYHLKQLLDAELIKKETKGTWSYYELNDTQVNHLLSEELCCLFRQK